MRQVQCAAALSQASSYVAVYGSVVWVAVGICALALLFEVNGCANMLFTAARSKAPALAPQNSDAGVTLEGARDSSASAASGRGEKTPTEVERA